MFELPFCSTDKRQMLTAEINTINDPTVKEKTIVELAKANRNCELAESNADILFICAHTLTEIENVFASNLPDYNGAYYHDFFRVKGALDIIAANHMTRISTKGNALIDLHSIKHSELKEPVLILIATVEQKIRQATEENVIASILKDTLYTLEEMFNAAHFENDEDFHHDWWRANTTLTTIATRRITELAASR